MEFKDITQRKIGAFEFAVIMTILGVFTNGIFAIVMAVFAVGLYFAKKHFGGEFSLAQLYGLFWGKTEKKETPQNG